MKYHEVAMGAVTGIASIAADDVLNWVGKIAMGVLVGVITGLTMRLIDWVRARKKP